MSSAKEIRTKIASIKNTQKITRAMELVAASKMRKAQDRMSVSKPYASKILQIIGHLALGNTEYQHPFLKLREPFKRVGYIVVSSDRGLCGGLNVALFKQVLQAMAAQEDQEIIVDVCAIGTKAQSLFNRLDNDVVAMADHLGDKPQVADLIGVVKTLLDAYASESIDALYLCSNTFVNTMTQKPEIRQLLPLVPEKNEQLDHHWDYLYEPDAKDLIDKLLRRYIETQVYQSVVENLACEQAARMVAMKSATDNAGEIIDDLKLVYNKARQAAITREISEIVAGADAVSE
jgi:F-type H+-transporting ATPase subunit gamma